MTSLERVMGRLAGTPVDRVPWFGLLSLYGAKYVGESMERYFHDPHLFAAGVDAVVERLGPDILAIPFSVALQAEAYGMPIRYPANGPPNLVIPDETTAAAWRQRVEPDPDSSGSLCYLREALELVLTRHGSTRTIIAGLAGPLELAVTLVGAEGLMDRLLFRQEEALALLEKTAAHFVRWTNQLFADGLHVAVFVGAFCNAEVLTPSLARFVQPIVAQALAQINGPVVFHHGGGKLMPLLHIWKDLPHVVGYYMDAREDLPAARALVGDAPLLFGNLNGPALATQSAATVQEQAHALLLRMQDDPRFILGTSGADIPIDTPEENILAIPRAILAMSGRAGQEGL